jgi:hypothetical protein
MEKSSLRFAVCKKITASLSHACDSIALGGFSSLIRKFRNRDTSVRH